jgi:hypothetical protein
MNPPEGRQGLHYHDCCYSRCCRRARVQAVTSFGFAAQSLPLSLHSSELNVHSSRPRSGSESCSSVVAPLSGRRTLHLAYSGVDYKLSEVARTGKDVSHILQYNSGGCPGDRAVIRHE